MASLYNPIMMINSLIKSSFVSASSEFHLTKLSQMESDENTTSLSVSMENDPNLNPSCDDEEFNDEEEDGQEHLRLKQQQQQQQQQQSALLTMLLIMKQNNSSINEENNVAVSPSFSSSSPTSSISSSCPSSANSISAGHVNSFFNSQNSSFDMSGNNKAKTSDIYCSDSTHRKTKRNSCDTNNGTDKKTNFAIVSTLVD